MTVARETSRPLTARLERPEPVVIDGGLATALELAGHDLSDDLWSARLVADQPAAVVEAHQAYVRAGAEVLITASYQATVGGFERVLHRTDGASLITATTALARQAVALEGRGGVLVGASCGPWGAVLADGSEYVGRYALSVDGLVEFHTDRLSLLAAGHPDVVACETIPCLDEVQALVQALPDAAPGLDAWISVTCGPDGSFVSGEPVEALAEVALTCEQVVAIGVNCSSPDAALAALTRLHRSAPDATLIAYPNAGQVWDGAERVWRGDGCDGVADDVVDRMLDVGVRIVGGCCGVGPAGIERLVAHLGPRR